MSIIKNNKAIDALLGIAVGDALGVPFEFNTDDQMQQNPAKDMIGFGRYNVPAGKNTKPKKMKYTIQNLQAQEIKRNFLFFWGHQPNKDKSIGKNCFSQWWQHPFKVNGISYPTAEHWMMASKAHLFQDQEIWEQILATKHPHSAKKLGRQVRNFNQKVWEENRFRIVLEGNLHKFGQNKELKTYLLNTGNSIIVEASPSDKIWGIGLKNDNPNAENMEKWEGQNLLGFALMEVRDFL